MAGMGDMMKAMQMASSLKPAWEQFVQNHPKFPAFLQAAGAKGFKEDTIIEITLTDPNGEKLVSSIKLKESDIELLNNLKNMRG